eukprot:1157843-Pelagomonas_calceolata.AAC.11
MVMGEGLSWVEVLTSGKKLARHVGDGAKGARGDHSLVLAHDSTKPEITQLQTNRTEEKRVGMRFQVLNLQQSASPISNPAARSTNAGVTWVSNPAQ